MLDPRRLNETGREDVPRCSTRPSSIIDARGREAAGEACMHTEMREVMPRGVGGRGKVRKRKKPTSQPVSQPPSSPVNQPVRQSSRRGSFSVTRSLTYSLATRCVN